MRNQSEGRPIISNFGINGQKLRDEEGVAYARVANYPTGFARHWIRRGTLLSESGKLYNPRESDWGRGGYELKEVTDLAYEAYLQFLRSGNEVHLRRAQREI